MVPTPCMDSEDMFVMIQGWQRCGSNLMTRRMIPSVRCSALRTSHLIETARPPAASTHFTYAAATYDLPGHLWQACTAHVAHEHRGCCTLQKRVQAHAAAQRICVQAS